MSAFSEVRWGRWVGLCGLVLLAEGLSRGVDGLLAIARDEAHLRGSNAVLLLDRSVWGDTRIHRAPADLAQAMLPREKTTARPRPHDGGHALRTRAAAPTASHRMRRLHPGAPRVAGRARERGRLRQNPARGARK
jgi:hypothetical protein